MKKLEKIGVGIACVLVAVVVVIDFAWIVSDLRYNIKGTKVDGSVISVSKEFAGFRNSEYKGTQPTFRYRYEYAFDVGGDRFTGESIASGPLKENDRIPIQFLDGDPSKHRVLMTGLQVVRIVAYAIAVIWIWAGVALVWSVIRKGRLRAKVDPFKLAPGRLKSADAPN